MTQATFSFHEDYTPEVFGRLDIPTKIEKQQKRRKGRKKKKKEAAKERKKPTKLARKESLQY